MVSCLHSADVVLYFAEILAIAGCHSDSHSVQRMLHETVPRGYPIENAVMIMVMGDRV